jgi:4-hydroxy-2-oxoheptanedioate aldolase
MTMKPRRTLQERLAMQPALVGLFQRYPHFTLAELAALSGYDFLVLDDEHGVFGEGDHLQTLRTVSFAEMAVFVRLRGHDLQAVGRYLDLGVDGIVAPNVATADQAMALVRAMEYPPAGIRGLGASAHRITRYGRDLAAHLKSPRCGACLLPIIESALGVSNVERILAVEGVDGAIVGPSDLTADLGCTGEYSNPAYTQAIARIERAAADRRKVLGTAPHPGHPLESLFARGHRLFIVGSDTSLISEAMNAQLAKARASFVPDGGT